ncbi:hypothetical protein [Roseobacter weihaiensis]|uniref:hypothetical protein n=1 Tax=Roseobacter weihaiensis TaxID=2763262 RepID=UPI001D09B47C|nr:hypothetical protein [Roseobacter sp. H9]
MVKKGMKKANSVLGVTAPSPRLTKTAAFLVAAALSIPVFLVLTLVELIWL